MSAKYPQRRWKGFLSAEGAEGKNQKVENLLLNTEKFQITKKTAQRWKWFLLCHGTVI